MAYSCNAWASGSRAPNHAAAAVVLASQPGVGRRRAETRRFTGGAKSLVCEQDPRARERASPYPRTRGPSLQEPICSSRTRADL